MHLPQNSVLVSTLLLTLGASVIALPLAKPDLNPTGLEPEPVRSWMYTPAARDHDYPPGGIPPMHLDSKRDIDHILEPHIPIMKSYPPISHHDAPPTQPDQPTHKHGLGAPSNDRGPLPKHDNKLKEYLQDRFPIGGPRINNPPQTDEELDKRAMNGATPDCPGVHTYGTCHREICKGEACHIQWPGKVDWDPHSCQDGVCPQIDPN
ncbi:MAG: hypothetical protein Q9213_002056 [Squamulea squamosa]